MCGKIANGEPFKFASERRPAVAVRTDEVIESAPPFATHESALSGIAARKFLGCAYFPSTSRAGTSSKARAG
jgi:hypothetical protein